MRSLCHRFQVVAPSTFLPAPIDDTRNTHAHADVSCARVDRVVDLANAVEDNSPTFVEVGVPSGSLAQSQY
eukprot:9112306-Pyramimonas_sp.AAC.1